MRKAIALAVVVLLAGCGTQGGTAGSTTTEPSRPVERTSTSTTTTEPPTTTTTIPKLQAIQEMGAEIERACSEAVTSLKDPAIRYDEAWAPYGSPDEVLQRAKQCADARWAAMKAEQARKEAEQRAAEEAARGTISQQNAASMAEDYLSSQGFSRSGLIHQLEYEGFSTADATWGVDKLAVDWNEQAARVAADYLDTQAFSRAGLIEQLIYEGFTQAQAEYGASTTGL